MKRGVRLPAFAKINLCLHILGKRRDGYHELRTLFQAVHLHDTLELNLVSRPGIFLHTTDAALPVDSSNLVWRAVEAMRCELRLRSGVLARLTKRIPVSRGLGGGSSDAAATIIGMLRLTGQSMALNRLIEIAACLGADVPFFLFGGRALGISRGDEIYPLPDAPRRSVLIVSPSEIAVSTRDAYRWADRHLTKAAVTSKIGFFCALCWSRQGIGLSNDFEAAVFLRHPQLKKIRRALLQGGAAEAALAGSGSAVYGIFRNPAQARRAAQGFPREQVFVTRTLSREDYRRALHWRATV